jgi:uncharacterized protein YndB with AHSA1/START domain
MERTFQAPAEAVFDAWTSEEAIRRVEATGRPRSRNSDATP